MRPRGESQAIQDAIGPRSAGSRARAGAHELYATALRSGLLFVRAEDGSLRELPVERWTGPLDPVDRRVIERAQGPVLDVGCGPGRHVLGLARRGVLALGVDIAPAAVRRARDRGAAVMLGSVFDPIPGASQWATALLLDGNIGIDGNPLALLTRLRRLLRAEGTILCEIDPPGWPTRSELVAVEDASGRRSEWFAWSRVGADAIAELASRAGLAVADGWTDRGRFFAALTLP